MKPHAGFTVQALPHTMHTNDGLISFGCMVSFAATPVKFGAVPTAVMPMQPCGVVSVQSLCVQSCMMSGVPALCHCTVRRHSHVLCV